MSSIHIDNNIIFVVTLILVGCQISNMAASNEDGFIDSLNFVLIWACNISFLFLYDLR